MLRPARDGDFDALAEIRRDSATQTMLLAVPNALEDDAVMDWIDRRTKDPNGYFRIIADPASDQPLGFVQITEIHHRNGCGSPGVALRRIAQGRGLGHVALKQVHEIALDLGLRKMLSYVRSDNHRALKMNLATGYRTVGTLRRHFRDFEGGFHDVLLLERMLDEA